MIATSAVTQLKSKFRGELLAPGDETYDAARKVFNAMIDRCPTLIARCTSDEDVVRAVNFAREQLVCYDVTGTSATGESSLVSTTYNVLTSYPNPFNAEATFGFALEHDAQVALAVYDVQGRERWCEAAVLAAGRRLLRWDGADRGAGRAEAGLYFVRVRVEGREFVRRFVRM